MNNSQNKKTRLIRDSLLSGVNGKGIKNKVHCQPIPGATIDKIKEKIMMYDLSQFKNIIIYCGGNDAAKSDIPSDFRKEYTADVMLPIYVSFFNLVLQTGIIPDLD